MGWSAVGILVALLVPADAVLAANQSVTASNYAFGPRDVTVNVGESVTWTNIGGSHNVRFDDGSFDQPADPADVWPAPVSRTFSTVGTFRYVCEAHDVSDNMTGTVRVLAAGAPPGPGPGAGLPPPVAADKVAPGLKLGGKRRQDVLGRRAVLVTVAVNEASAVSAKGTVSVPGASKVFRLRKASRQLEAGAKATLKLKLPPQASRAFRRALARKVKLTARLTVTAKDAAGNTRTAKRRVSLRR
jgi:plastocyanin